MLELHCPVEEMTALEAKYSDDVGFNYSKFLKDLEPSEAPKLMYKERLVELRKVNSTKRLPEITPCTDLEGVLNKIKIKVGSQGRRAIQIPVGSCLPRTEYTQIWT